MSAPSSQATLAFRPMVNALENYWAERGCAVLEPYDLPMGAGTFHPATFLRSLGPDPWRCVYVQGCRRPSDGRYGDNPIRLQHYYQMQVILKPPPDDIQNLYIESLRAIGIEPLHHDIRFAEDNWESPTLGAWGLGWEVRVDGTEVSQFTYFQQIGGAPCELVSGEITYGLERLAMFLQGCDSVYDLVWDDRGDGGAMRYGDVFRRNEREQSAYNFDHEDTPTLLRRYDETENEGYALLKKGLALPAHDHVILASHLFNLLDARHALSVTERQRYVLRIRKLASAVVREYLGDEDAGDDKPPGAPDKKAD